MFYADTTRTAAAENVGFNTKKELTKENNTVDVTLQLNRYPFFSAFRNQVAPLGKMGINVTLNEDNDPKPQLPNMMARCLPLGCFSPAAIIIRILYT